MPKEIEMTVTVLYDESRIEKLKTYFLFKSHEKIVLKKDMSEEAYEQEKAEREICQLLHALCLNDHFMISQSYRVSELHRILKSLDNQRGERESIERLKKILEYWIPILGRAN